MAGKKKRKNVQDATLKNIRALKKEVADLWRAVRMEDTLNLDLAERVTALEKKLAKVVRSAE
jgi:hypothetical protein